jgi:hypothetical protein
MGCSGSRGSLNEEERAIVQGEDMLGYQKVKTKVLIEQFKKYAHLNKLNKNAFELAARNANLDVTGFDKKDNFRGAFYGKLGTDVVFPE